MGKRVPPLHPGEVLRADFMEAHRLTAERAAQRQGVPPQRINEIVHGSRAVTADTALRLARLFGTTAEFWLNLQAHHDLERQRDLTGAEIRRTVKRIAI